MAYAVAVALAGSGREIARLGLLGLPRRQPFVATKPPSLRGPMASLRGGPSRKGETLSEIAGAISGLVMRTGNARMLLGLGSLRRFRLPLNMQEHLNKPITCRHREKLLLDLIDRMQTAKPQV